MHKTRPGAPRSLAGKAFFIAIQIAKAFGAQVFATDSEPKRDYIEQLGATFINYRTEAADEYVTRYTSEQDLIWSMTRPAV
jgi:NADPH:quinone reductase-like Zn-dependent oxidoreductase